MSNATQYSGSRSDTDRKPSASVWGDCRWNDIRAGQLPGTTFFEDFISGGVITSPTTEAALVGLPISGFGSAGSTITYGNAVNGGGSIVLAETTNQEGVIVRSASASYQVSANLGQLWFECRIKPKLIATNEMAFIAGLMDTTAASATAPLTMTSGAIADVNFVGFHKPVANTSAFDTSYKSNGNAIVEVNSDVGTLVADTYVKLGMRFEPRKSNVLSFYINGVKQAATKTVPDNTGTDFPADVALGWVIGMCVGSAASDNELTIDWIRVAQEMAT